MRLLADTSVIVNSLRSIRTRASALFDQQMAEGALPSITPDVYREVLQGAKDADHFRALREHLVRMPMVAVADGLNMQSGSAWLYASLRWRGITINSAIDCTIALTAVENDLALLHDDQDFLAIARVEPRLKLA